MGAQKPATWLLSVATVFGFGCLATNLTGSEGDRAKRSNAPAGTAESTPVDVICSIADDIERLKGKHPQLAEFAADKHCDASVLKIEYRYRTFRRAGGGWLAAVPNPYDDGIWLYIDFHDPDADRPHHKQKVAAPLYFRDKKVTFLILEGNNSKDVAADIYKMLHRHGIHSKSSAKLSKKSSKKSSEESSKKTSAETPEKSSEDSPKKSSTP